MSVTEELVSDGMKKEVYRKMVCKEIINHGEGSVSGYVLTPICFILDEFLTCLRCLVALLLLVDQQQKPLPQVHLLK